LRFGRWNLLLLDISMPDRNGLDILENVVLRFPDTRVLVVSGFPERLYALKVLRSGAHGYLHKECAPEDLMKAVRVVMQGRHYVGPEVTQLLLSRMEPNSEQPVHTSLSAREFQVFYKLASGCKPSAIGDELCLSVKTVSTYRTRILEKMRLTSNADITAYAFRHALIQ
jgi:two-component system, NarL family, invasion response regulator UvrY